MDYQTYQKIRTHCWQILAAYIDTSSNNDTLELRYFIGGGGLVELDHEMKIANGLFLCRDLTLLENAAAHLLFVVSNHRAHTWQREPSPPNGQEPAPPLEQWQSDELANQTREAVLEFADLLPPGEAASLIKACNRALPATAPPTPATSTTGVSTLYKTAEGITKGQVLDAFGKLTTIDLKRKHLKMEKDCLAMMVQEPKKVHREGYMLLCGTRLFWQLD
jgi:hypothetical protein